jgi:hypothetical protein
LEGGRRPRHLDRRVWAPVRPIPASSRLQQLPIGIRVR